MTTQPTTPAGRDLFDLAARLLDLDPIDLLRVRLEGTTLIVLLVTGQKYHFDAGNIAARLETIARSQLAPPTVDQRRGEAFPDALPVMLHPSPPQPNPSTRAPTGKALARPKRK